MGKLHLASLPGRLPRLPACRGTPLPPSAIAIVPADLDRDSMRGFWLSGRVTEAKTPESPMPMEGMFHLTWDPGSKQYVMLWVDNTGGWAQENSAGWQGDTIVWSGDAWAGGQKAGMKDSFTFKGAGEMLHTMEINMTGQWLPLGQETCRAVAAHASPKKP